MKAAILGASGYTGSVLLRLLLHHREVTEILPVSFTKAGRKLLSFDPGLPEDTLEAKGAAKFCNYGEVTKEGNPDVIFSALPHLKSAEYCKKFINRSVIIDLSADFRIPDPGIFRKAYGVFPPEKKLLNQAVYGLCEWNREKIKRSDLIANPGCYPTAVLLPLLPLVSAELTRGLPVANVLTGISGGGRSPKEKFLYSERTENMGAYSAGRNHRHYHEMTVQMQSISGKPDGDLIFNPHLVPVKQGMAATITVPLKKHTTSEAVSESFRDAYSDEPFIRIREEEIPETRHVRWTNRCDIGFQLSGEICLLFSVIDNLLKGASGQALQCMNIRFGIKETEGLNLMGEI
jgi:N-acetyl-gamma-glutamyl-phosphate reductase